MGQSTGIPVTAPATVRPSSATPRPADVPGSDWSTGRVGAIVERVCVARGDIIEPDQVPVQLRDDRQQQAEAHVSKSRVFDALDLDGNGKLSKEELVEVCTRTLHQRSWLFPSHSYAWLTYGCDAMATATAAVHAHLVVGNGGLGRSET